MHPCAHVASTGFVVISHAFNIDNLVIVYYLMAYTFIDTFYIFENVRRDSLIIHHLVTLHVLSGCALDHDLIPLFAPLGMLEWTTFFNSLNQVFKNRITLMCRNTSWVLIRMLYLPFAVFQILSRLDVDNLDHSYCVLTLLILSYEWSLELLKIDFKFLSSTYYLVPVMYLESRRVEYAFVSLGMVAFSTAYMKRYEARLVFNLGIVNIMQRVYSGHLFDVKADEISSVSQSS